MRSRSTPAFRMQPHCIPPPSRSSVCAGWTPCTSLRGAMRLSRTPSTSSAALLVLAVIATAVGCSQGAANVTLRNIIIYRQYNLISSPDVFFACTGQYENRTDLSFLKVTDKLYNNTGLEEWQPVLALGANQCVVCGVFQRMWFENIIFGQWNVCTTDFSSANGPDYFLPLSVNGTVSLNLSCPACPAEDYNQVVLSGTNNTGPSPTVWILVGIFGLALVSFIIIGLFIGIMMSIIEEAHEEAREDKSNFLEGFRHPSTLSESSSAHGEGRQETELAVRGDSLEDSIEEERRQRDDDGSERDVEEGHSEREEEGSDCGEEKLVNEDGEEGQDEDEEAVLAEIRRVLRENQRRVSHILRISDILKENPNEFL